MDKNAIKKYAVWARRELIERVSQRAMFYGVSTQSIGDPNAEEVNGRLLSPVEKKQRQALIQNVKEKGFNQVMEEVAYTWFNRFAALRFMEVNGYLPSLVRVFTNEAGEFKPQILSEALHLDMEGLDKQKVLELESGNKSEELFRYLLIVQCNALNSILPGMFQKIEDYTELLLPDNLLRDGSVIEQMVASIPEEDWTDQVQIIGWLYQYYNTEPKDKVFADLKRNIKISKENIPAATQLFTPDWIVHYMVENSLGRLWLEGHPNDALKSEWKYYLDEAEQEPEVEAQLAEIRKEYAALKPEEIKVIDPCCGSGHILVVMFDVLVQIYEDYGYTAREAVSQILENNLWGLDIDERAAQLSYFAVMMKARQYDRRFFSRKVQPHVYAIEESNGITEDDLSMLGGKLNDLDRNNALNQMSGLLQELHDAKEYGSLITATPCDWRLLRHFNAPRQDDHIQIMLGSVDDTLLSARLTALLDVAEALAQKYHAVVTNPPYMSNKGMMPKLSSYVQNKFEAGKTDMYAAFMLASKAMTRDLAFTSMITQHSWMFLSSQEDLRIQMLNKCVVNMVHLGSRAFDEISGEVVQTTAFVSSTSHLSKYNSTFVRLIDYNGEIEKEKAFLQHKGFHVVPCDNFLEIPGKPVAYWLSKKALRILASSRTFDELAVTRAGMITGDNSIFVRLWFEVDITKSKYTCSSREEAVASNMKWFPYSKGGEFRKWYGNNDCVVNWFDDGVEMRNRKDDKGNIPAHAFNLEYIFKSNICWNSLSSRKFSARYTEKGYLYDAGGSFASIPLSKIKYYLGFLNSCVAFYYLSALNPTMNFQKGNVGNLPVLMGTIEQTDKISALVDDCVNLSENDWDDFEYSWNFKEHPLIKGTRVSIYKGNTVTIECAFKNWTDIAECRFLRLKENEETLNRYFIDIYGLNADLSPSVDADEITVRRSELRRDIISLISYAVGCMFGRYTLGFSGIVYAGGDWDNSKYSVFRADEDAIIPICDDEYFDDDIVGRFVNFVEIVYGVDTLEENLRFIADALGGKGSPREVIRSYFINEFYVDHLKTYQKRPIYWLFDSGKKNGFKCLIYMHRYQPDTIARIRTDYVHEQQSRYRTAIADLEHRAEGTSPTERVRLTKQLSKIRDQSEELRVYEEKIHHLADQMLSIDLDDGVKHNYDLFKDILVKIR